MYTAGRSFGDGEPVEGREEGRDVGGKATKRARNAT